jgi:hypothetical protein
MPPDTAHCPTCSRELDVRADYVEMSGDWRLFCDQCGKQTQLSANGGNLANLQWRHWILSTFNHEKFCRVLEIELVPCDCGGRFRVNGRPRCAACLAAFSQDDLRALLGLPEYPRQVFSIGGVTNRTRVWCRSIKPVPFEAFVVPVLAIFGAIGMFVVTLRKMRAKRRAA